MSKRVSVVEPPSQESIPEANELDQQTPRRSHSNRDHLKPVRTEAPGVPSPSNANSPKSSVPPSPARPRASSAISNPRTPQQSLDAAAQIVASRPSDVSRKHVPGPINHTHDHHIGPERRPRLTTEIQIPSSATPATATPTAAKANGNISPAVPPLPRRTATAPAFPLDKRTRPRRPTNTSTKDISSPILDPGQSPNQPFSLLSCWPVFLILNP